jgi:Chain length determinant protein
MDLLAMLASLRRHKWTALAIVVLTLGGMAFVAFGVPPRYESKALYVLVPPPGLPTEGQLKQDPGLAALNSNNPYLRLPNASVVADVLGQRVAGDNVRDELVAQGADKDYEIGPTNLVGGGLGIEIVGTGGSAAAASRTLDLVTQRMLSELRRMQTVDGAADRYLITALPVDAPTEPVRLVTSTIRSIIAVAVAGLVLLFSVLSIAEAARLRRRSPDERPADRWEPHRPSRFDSELTVVLPQRSARRESEAAHRLPLSGAERSADSHSRHEEISAVSGVSAVKRPEGDDVL